jgi:hypothetical protein
MATVGTERTQPVTSPVNSAVLLALVMTTIFIIPVFPVQSQRILHEILYTAILIVAVITIDRGRRTILPLAVTAIVLEWVSYLWQLSILYVLSKTFNAVFFVVVIISLIIQIARTKSVTGRVIIESINGYLLLGVIFSMLVTVIVTYNPEAYSLPSLTTLSEQPIYNLSDYTYYAFVTFTTIGYGDIVPTVSYTRSLAILSGVTGQLYIAVIIAMLVGKFAGSSSD